MKVTLLVLALAISAHTFSQNPDIPQKEFELSLSQGAIQVSRGESKQIKITILKSKRYVKNNVVMGLSSSLPEGLSISFSPDKGDFEVTEATVVAQSNTPPGEYSIIINATANYKKKGSVLKITVL